MARRLLSSLVLAHTLCGRPTPAHAFIWPSAAVASLRASSRSSHLQLHQQRGFALPGRVLTPLLGLPLTSSLGLRAVSDSPSPAPGVDSPDSAWEVVRTPGDGSCLFHAVEAAVTDPQAKKPAAELRFVMLL